MDELTEFLNARLDEDEAAAKAVTFRSRFMAVDISVKSPGGLGNPPMPIADVIDAQTAAHIARHDPARVLREVAAKRRMLEDLDLTYPDEGLLVRLLASAYSDHPDYRAEWATGSSASS